LKSVGYSKQLARICNIVQIDLFINFFYDNRLKMQYFYTIQNNSEFILHYPLKNRFTAEHRLKYSGLTL